MTNSAPKTVRQFGPYQLLEKLGHGGTAVVYKGQHRQSGAVVALKIVTDASIADPTIEKRFRREFELARTLNHPHLVRAIEYGQHGDHLYQALEFISGKNLDQVIRDNGALPLRDALRLFIQIGEALQCLHDNGVAHRDIKPSNIILEADGAAKLCDFGLLKNCDGQTSALTRSRQSLGTMGYGAPEQFEDAKRADHRCDLYSLAGTFYTSVTGKLPFGTGGNLKILRRKMLNQFVPLCELTPEIDEALDAYVSRALQANPRLRPASVVEFLVCLKRQLRALESGQGRRVAPASTAEGKNRRRAERRPVDLAAICEPMFDKGRQSWTAAIVDLSPGGMCLRATCEFPVDTILQVQLQAADCPADAWHLVRVRWVKPSARKTWNLGCVLLHPLSAVQFAAIQETGVPKKVALQANDQAATGS